MGGYVPVQTEVNACNSAGVRYLHLIKCPCKYVYTLRKPCVYKYVYSICHVRACTFIVSVPACNC